MPLSADGWSPDVCVCVFAMALPRKLEEGSFRGTRSPVSVESSVQMNGDIIHHFLFRD